MNKSIVLFCVVLFSIFAFGQIKSLEENKPRFNELYQKKSISDKDIEDMLWLTIHLQESDDPSALPYLQKLKPLIEKNKYYDGWELYCHQIHIIYRKQNDFVAAEKIVREILEKYKNKLSDKVYTDVSISYMSIIRELHQYDQIIEISQELLAKKPLPLQEASINFMQCHTYVQTGDFKKALPHGLKAYDIYLKENDRVNACMAANIIAETYRNTKNYDKAEEFYFKALDLANQTKNPHDLMLIYSNLGNLYNTTDENEKALLHFEKGLELARQNNRNRYIAQNMQNLGTLYLKMKEYKKAEECYKTSLKLCYDYNIDFGVMLNYISLGNLNNSLKNYKEALHSYDSALVYVKRLKLPADELSLYEGYFELYRNMGNYQKALEYSEKYHKLKDQLTGEDTQKEIAEIQIKYETEVKDRQIEKMNHDFEQKKAQNKLLLMAIIAIVLITGFLIFFLIYRNKSLKELYERNLESLNSFAFTRTITSAEAPKDPNRELFDKLLDALEAAKIYKNPMLSLSDTAKLLNTNDKYLSKAISDYSKMNYSNFINFYRINEAKRLLLETNLSVNEVMYESGFNSKSPFYTAFSKHTGMSPKQFKEFSIQTADSNRYESVV